MMKGLPIKTTAVILVLAIWDPPLVACTSGNPPGSPPTVLHQLALSVGRADLNLTAPVKADRLATPCSQSCLLPLLPSRFSRSSSRAAVGYQTALAGMNFASAITG